MAPAAAQEAIAFVLDQGLKAEGDGHGDLFPPGWSESSPTGLRDGDGIVTGKEDLRGAEVEDVLFTTRASPSPSPSPVLRGRQEKEGEYWITLTVTQPTETYTTTVLLGDSYPSSFTTSPTPAASSSSLHTASIIGIVVGVIGGVAVLLGIGIMYVWLLRARHVRGKGKGKGRGKRRRRRRRGGSGGSGSGSGSGSASGGGGDAVPGPPPEAVPAPAE